MRTTGPERPIRVVAISGSLRKASHNTALLTVAGSVAPEDMEFEIADISDLPLYNHDDEEALGFAGPTARLRQQVLAADALLIASPEYNSSVTGALKNALDWLSRSPSPVDRIPVAMMSGAGRLGGAGSLSHLRDILRNNHMQVVAEPEVMVTSVGSKFDGGGRFVDERAIDQIRRLMVGLRRLVIQSRVTATRVLIVSADTERLRSARVMLRSEGHRPVPATHDEEALRQLKQRPFELVLIDAAVERDMSDRIAVAATDSGIAVGTVSGADAWVAVLDAQLNRLYQ